MNRKIIAILSAISIFGQVASASILGESIISWSQDIADGVIYNHNKFMSEQSGVGRQSEHYAVYTPNNSIKPVIISGEALWGRETITQAEEYMKSNGLVPMLGVNASYFSYETGLPMGHIISDGKILSKDTETYQSIGFKEDGSAFIAPLKIDTTLSFEKTITRQIIERIPVLKEETDTTVISDDETKENTIDDTLSEEENDIEIIEEPEYIENIVEVSEDRKFDIDIAHINKYNQKTMDIVNLYTADFGESNHSEAQALTLILGDIDGELRLGEEITAVVEEKFSYDSSISIPKDKLVITVNEIAKPELYESLNYLEVGDEVSIINTCNDLRWEKAESALGSVGETLIADGKITDGLNGSAAPRTAVGIKENGDVVFYVIDGRQSPLSYGARVETLAKRMLELGCVDAINLDGGGSTAISGIYPGCDASQIFNSPSDKKLRACTNYIFLHNTKKATDKFNKAYFYPFEQHYLSGYTDKIDVKAVDTAYYKTDVPEDLEFTIENSESTYEDGILTAIGTGNFTLNAELDEENVGSASYFSYETPTEILVTNAEDGSEISALSMKKGDEITINASSKYNYIDLLSTNDCYTFNVTEEIGYFEGNKLIVTSDGGEGIVSVSAGEFVKEIPISIEHEFPFDDIYEHWARLMIKEIYKKNIVSGYEIDESFVFMPDNNMTREEFAVIIGRFLEIDIENYQEYELTFADNDAISDWSRPYVAAMYDSQVINGKASGEEVNFAPKDTITRAEAITILGRTIEDISEYEITFADFEEIPEWARENVIKMTGLGYVSGYEDDTIRPNNFVTRAEAVTLLYKMLKKEC